MTTSNHDFESLLIEREGIQLHAVRREGSGPPVIVVPGAMADSHDFIAAVRAMNCAGPVLILDRRGRRQSGAQGAGYNLHTEIGDLRAWIDHLKQPVHLVGWSLGGTITLETAAQDTRVESVVAYDPVLPPFAEDAVSTMAEADLDERVVIINRDISGLEPELVEAMKEQPEWPHLRELARPLAAELAALNDFTPSTEWDNVAATLIVGERSHSVEPYGPAFDRVSERIPRAPITVLPGQGHLAHLEDPTLLGTTIGDLLTEAVST